MRLPGLAGREGRRSLGFSRTLRTFRPRPWCSAEHSFLKYLPSADWLLVGRGGVVASVFVCCGLGTNFEELHGGEGA